MIDNNQDVKFENLAYGAYLLEELGIFSENVKYTIAEFMKLNVRRIRLPEGKGNIVYLLTNTFDNSINMINSKNFVIPPTYQRFFYPWIGFGNFMGRRYKYNLNSVRNDRLDILKARTNLRPVSTRNLTKTSQNVFFCVSDLYETFKPIIERFPIKRIYSEFFKEFDDVLKELTPEPLKVSDNKEWNNRLIIIDADGFAFKPGAPLKENQTNPLFIIYLAYLRDRDLTSLNVDRDMLLCSKNMFIKFNPSRMTPDKWNYFKTALFKIMNTNLDDYTSQLTPEEKEEVTKTSKDYVTHTIVDKAIEPFTKLVSPETKGTLGSAIDSSIRAQVKGNSAINQTVKNNQESIAKNINKSNPVNASSNDKHKDSLFQKVISPKLDPQKGTSVINTNPYSNISKKRQKLFDAIDKDYRPLALRTNEEILDDDDEDTIEDYEDDIRDDVNNIMTNDNSVKEEVLDDIQEKISPMKNMKNSTVNTVRDQKLREAQKELIVKDSTIEQILMRDVTNIPIKTENKSEVLKTSNKNMHNIKFANFDKTYIDELYTKDLVACFDMLKDKNSPFFITGIEVKDTSTNMDLKETWTVHLVDENKKRHTIKVDIPKFYQNRFMLIGGNKYIILKQNFYNPLVKDTPNTVIITTNYNKVTIQRKATKSLASIERIFSLVKKPDTVDIFIAGDSTKGNLKYLSSLEYDELSRRLFKYSSGKCEIYFSRDYIKENLSEKIPKDIKGDEFFIGTEGNVPILINEDTGKDRTGRTIAGIIEDNLSDEHKAIFNSIKVPKQNMFVEGKLAGQFIPIIATLITWIGISKSLDKMQIKWTFHPDMKRAPKEVTNMNYIRFADGVLEYEPQMFAELIMNGLSKLNPEKFTFEAFNTEEGYIDYIHSVWGNYTGITELRNFYEFLVDPITKDVCRDLLLPTEPDELLIYAVKLLCDNAFVSKASDKSYRTRSVEMIPAILYSCIANQYKTYVKTGRREPMTLNQRIVISKLMAEKTVDEYSTLNPAIEVGKMHSISTRGYKGSNSEHSYDEEKRSYDPSAIGKIAMSTSADANVGISRELVIEPTLKNARGYRDPVDDLSELKDVNLFSPIEMLTPGTVRVEDPIRTAIAGKQSQHLVPVANASPTLVSNGFDEAIQFHLSNDFVINAEEDGQVVEIDTEVGFIMVKYKSGKTQAININPEVVKNSGGGFYIANTLKPTVNKVGQKFKKDEVLAYHDKYFKYSKLGGVRYAIGPLVKVAFMSSYNTYEDAGIATVSLADKMKTSIVYMQPAPFKRNSNILQMVKIGDHVGIGDSLIKYDISFEDNEIAKYLSKLSEDNQALLEEETRNDIKSEHAGKVIDVKVYTLLDPSNLSPSLGAVVQEFFDKGISRKKFLEKHDNSEGIIKAGYMLTDSTEPIVNRYNTIKGKYKGIDVLIEIFIEHADVMGVGDKVALYSANKQIISEVIPEGYEPYSEFRPEEEISVITSPGTIARRMTPGVIPVSAATKVMLELKRKIKESIKYK